MSPLYAWTTIGAGSWLRRVWYAFKYNDPVRIEQLELLCRRQHEAIRFWIRECERLKAKLERLGR